MSPSESYRICARPIIHRVKLRTAGDHQDVRKIHTTVSVTYLVQRSVPKLVAFVDVASLHRVPLHLSSQERWRRASIKTPNEWVHRPRICSLILRIENQKHKPMCRQDKHGAGRADENTYRRAVTLLYLFIGYFHQFDTTFAPSPLQWQSPCRYLKGRAQVFQRDTNHTDSEQASPTLLAI